MKLVHIPRYYNVTEILTYLLMTILFFVRFVSLYIVQVTPNMHARLERDWYIFQDSIVSQRFLTYWRPGWFLSDWFHTGIQASS